MSAIAGIAPPWVVRHSDTVLVTVSDHPRPHPDAISAVLVRATGRWAIYLGSCRVETVQPPWAGGADEVRAEHARTAHVRAARDRAARDRAAALHESPRERRRREDADLLERQHPSRWGQD